MITDNDVHQCRLQTIRDVIRYAMTQFETHDIFCGHGCANTYEEAYFLVLRSLKLNFEDSDRFWDARVSNAELKMLLECIEKRAVEKVPTPYLLKEAWLIDHPFYCDERVLIPRSYIAELKCSPMPKWIAWISARTLLKSPKSMCSATACRIALNSLKATCLTI